MSQMLNPMVGGPGLPGNAKEASAAATAAAKVGYQLGGLPLNVLVITTDALGHF